MKIKNLMLIILLCSMVTSGCATSGGYAQQSNIGYERFLDANDEYRIVRRNNDLWLDRIDGSEKRQVTNTPTIKEMEAYITKDGKSMIYCYKLGDFKCFYQTLEGDDSNKKEVSFDEYHHHAEQRINQKRGR